MFKYVQTSGVQTWISKQVQAWAQITVLEMVYVFLRQVFEMTRIIMGTQIPRGRDR